MSATLRPTKPGLLVVLAFIFLALCRIAGPSDLYDKEQPRTTSYTADIVLHNHWILPTDNFDIPATKTPLFNWISAPVVALFGFHEWTLKFPSLLAVGIMLICIDRAAKLFAAPRSVEVSADSPTTSAPQLAALASLVWLSTFTTAKLLYVARPDMLDAACLNVAWLAATAIIRNRAPRRGIVLLFWLAVAAAGLTKGPFAILPVAYLLVAPKLLTNSWQPLKRAGLYWGIPLVGAIGGVMCLLILRQNPEFFWHILLGREFTQRIAGGASGSHSLQWLETTPNGFFYIFSRFLPWSLLPVAALICWIYKKLTKRAARDPATDSRPGMTLLGACTLWIAIIAFFFCFLSTKRADRYAPIWPPIALITAQLALQLAPKLRLRFAHLAALPLLFLLVIVLNNQYLDTPARSKLGDNLLHFTAAVSQKTDHDTILFEDGEQTPLQTLLARHQSLTPSDDYLQSAKWAIRFYDPHDPATPTLISKPIAQIDGPGPGRLALYPLAPKEGRAEFERSQRVPRLYSDENSSALHIDLDPATARWLQFWRQHTPPPAPR